MLHDSLNFAFYFQGAIHVNDRVVPQPSLQKLSAEKLTREGAFLMDCGSVSITTALTGRGHTLSSYHPADRGTRNLTGTGAQFTFDPIVAYQINVN